MLNRRPKPGPAELVPRDDVGGRDRPVDGREEVAGGTGIGGDETVEIERGELRRDAAIVEVEGAAVPCGVLGHDAGSRAADEIANAGERDAPQDGSSAAS